MARTQGTSTKADLERVEDARFAVRVLRLLAWLAFGLGIISLALLVVGLVGGVLSLEQAIAGAFSSSFFAILSGATAYGSGSNLDINASRMERDIHYRSDWAAIREEDDKADS